MPRREIGFKGAKLVGAIVDMEANPGLASSTKTQIAALTPVSVANATDATTAAALANANKAAINAVIAALKA